jgi:hypothetical protein
MSNTKNTQKVKKPAPVYADDFLPKSIRVKSKTEYTIEVNDKGETISFDLADVGLPDKMIKMLNMIETLQGELNTKSMEISSREDKPYNDFISQNEYDSNRLIVDFFQKARDAADEFLGLGACQKIFGDKNYFVMFDDLVEQLEPHFKKMGIKLDQLKQNATDKYVKAINEDSGMFG